MQYSQLNGELLTRFPELHDGYAHLKGMWDGEEPGSHVVYGRVLVPYLMRLLRSQESKETLNRAFSFLEELAISDDETVLDLLGASVLEALADEPDVRSRAREYMGPATKELARKVHDDWG